MALIVGILENHCAKLTTLRIVGAGRDILSKKVSTSAKMFRMVLKGISSATSFLLCTIEDFY